MAIFITTYGCFSLANNPNIIIYTYWVAATAYNTSKDGGPPAKLADEHAFAVYVGLTSLVEKRCVPGSGCFLYQTDLIPWWQTPALGLPDGLDLCLRDASLSMFCNRCRDVAVGNIRCRPGGRPGRRPGGRRGGRGRWGNVDVLTRRAAVNGLGHLLAKETLKITQHEAVCVCQN